MSDDGLPVVVLSITFKNSHEVVGVFGPYESEAEAGEHVGILFRDPEMQKRMMRHRPYTISTGQYRLDDPSAFAERVEELLTDG
jgi:hypothetical protein